MLSTRHSKKSEERESRVRENQQLQFADYLASLHLPIPDPPDQLLYDLDSKDLSPEEKSNGFRLFRANAFSLPQLPTLQNVQGNVSKRLELKKWNETTLGLKIQDALLTFGMQHLNFKVLKHMDILKQFIEMMNNSENIAYYYHHIALTTQPIQHDYLQELITQIQKTPKDEERALEAMSASSFFKLLFFDKDINKTMNIESKCQLGDALLFALWKESVEYAIMMEDPSYLSLVIQNPLAKYDPSCSSMEEQRMYFNHFCKGTLPQQIQGVDMDDSSQHLAKLLRISPWCGLHVVIHDSYTTASHWPVSQIKNRQLRHILKKLVANVLDEQTDTNSKLMEYLMLGFDKRMLEHQLLLAQVASCLKGVAQEEEEEANDEIKNRFQRLYNQANALKQCDMIFDSNQSMQSYTKQFKGSINKLLKDPRNLAMVDQIVGKIQEEFQTHKETFKSMAASQWQSVQNSAVVKEQLPEMASTAMADILSKTYTKLLHKVIHSEAFMPVVLCMVAYSTGLFAHTQTLLVKALTQIIHG